MKARIKIVDHVKYAKVNYYSLMFEDETICETEKFKSKFENSQYKESYQTLRYWLAVIGEHRGARSTLFRKESLTNEDRYKKAKALPPDAEVLNFEKDHNSKYIGLEDEFKSELRLYCLWMDPSVVILYNGSVKSANDVRECLNCYPFFKNTNSLSVQLHSKQEEYEVVERRIKKASLVQLEVEKI